MKYFIFQLVDYNRWVDVGYTYSQYIADEYIRQLKIRYPHCKFRIVPDTNF